jgi:hypothetical protein
MSYHETIVYETNFTIIKYKRLTAWAWDKGDKEKSFYYRTFPLFGIPKPLRHKSRAKARPTGRAVSRYRLGDLHGPMAV